MYSKDGENDDEGVKNDVLIIGPGGCSPWNLPKFSCLKGKVSKGPSPNLQFVV